ncbi:alpha/beta-hydrolase, partial [Atractiella rhizophila]
EDSELLPVLVWFDDVAFTSTKRKAHYPARLVQKSVEVNLPTILVTLNYRLGANGYFVFGGMPNEHLSMGLKDQRAALRWLKNHIAEFGGDPEKVTIIGQDSGAASIGHHLLFSEDEQLFRAAIMQSGYPTSFPTNTWLDTVLRSSNLLGVRVGCEHVEPWLDCVNDASFDVLLGASNSMYEGGLGIPWYPNIDEQWITERPSVRMKRDGSWKAVPVLCGSLFRESTQYILPTVGSPDALKAELSKFVTLGRETDPLAPIFDQLHSLYSKNSSSLQEEFRSLVADITVHAPRRMFMQFVENAWGYLLSEEDGSDGDLTWLDPEARKKWPMLSDTMAKYFLCVAFLETTDTYWPRYGEAGNMVSLKENNVSVFSDDFRIEELRLINDNNDLFNR